MRALVVVIFLVAGLSVFSQSDKLKELEDKRKKALREIENYNKRLNDTKKTTTTLLSRIELLAGQITKRNQLVNLLEQEIKQITKEQQQLEEDITTLEADMKEKQKSYAKAIEGMLATKNSNKLIYILSGRSLSESFRRFMYLREYSEWRANQADEIKKQKDELNSKKTILENSRKEKIALLAARESEQKKLETEQKKHQEEVADAKKKQQEIQALIKKQEQQANALNNEIRKLIAAEVLRQKKEAERLAAEKKKKEKEQKATEKSTKPSKPATASKPEKDNIPVVIDEKITGSFASNMGKLPMPVTGRGVIIGNFGEQRHATSLKLNKDGIDIQTDAGADARTIFDGEVAKVFAHPGYNLCVMVRHGEYFTLYVNIKNVYVKANQKVKTGQALGTIYVDDDTGITQMHFQLWKGNRVLNPQAWIKH